MIDTLLALVPTYGVWLIMASVALSCLALPVPSSMLVMAAGGFAAAGDFNYWQLVLFAYVGFVIGDQVAFGIARVGGAPLLARFGQKPKAAKILKSAEAMVAKHGSVAVILTRTIFSPIGPYVAYISGALRLDWPRFTIAAALGAAMWCMGYSWLGYTFAGRIADIASLIGSSAGITLAGAVVIGLIWWLLRNYRAHQLQAPD